MLTVHKHGNNPVKPGNVVEELNYQEDCNMAIKTWQSDAVTIKVDYDKCIGHGNCADSCPAEVYEIENGKAVPVNIDDCVECCTCVEVCPENAIEHSACK
jgi:NAD-dependent dihydropyrimidine dehydrogenase PreA subunit